MAIVKDYLERIKEDRRDILLYGYPTSDAPVNRKASEKWFPRCADEIQKIE